MLIILVVLGILIVTYIVLDEIKLNNNKDNTIDVKSLYNYADETFRARLRELDQEEKDAEACETIDGYEVDKYSYTNHTIERIKTIEKPSDWKK